MLYQLNWGPLLNVELVYKINVLKELPEKRSFRYGVTSKLLTIDRILNSAVEDLFCKMQLTSHCLHPLLPPDKTLLSHMLSARGHAFQLLNFVISYLFKFLA